MILTTSEAALLVKLYIYVWVYTFFRCMRMTRFSQIIAITVKLRRRPRCGYSIITILLYNIICCNVAQRYEWYCFYFRGFWVVFFYDHTHYHLLLASRTIKGALKKGLRDNFLGITFFIRLDIFWRGDFSSFTLTSSR